MSNPSREAHHNKSNDGRIIDTYTNASIVSEETEKLTEPSAEDLALVAQALNSVSPLKGTNEIVAVKKDDVGNVIGVKLDNGEVLTLRDAIAWCEAGRFPGYIVASGPQRDPYIREIGDDDDKNDLDNLPEF